MVFLQKPPQISNGTLPGIPSFHLGTVGSFVASLCRPLSLSVVGLLIMQKDYPIYGHQGKLPWGDREEEL